ncbi:MAG: nucleotide exchange factor GrpE [candidate division Zixibacteria bacterium]
MSKKTHRAAELAAYKTGAKKPVDVGDDKDRYLRLAAEFDNYKKRIARQFSEIVEKANDGLFMEFLDVIDDFERALDSAADKETSSSDQNQNIIAGMKLIYEKLMTVLKNKDVERMDVLDKPFDPVFHEAVMQTQSDKAEGTVIDIVSPGYIQKGRVIRHAKVVVASSNNEE